METQYVYHATCEIEWEGPRDLGLFHKKLDAKKACQEDAEFPLVWDYADKHRTTTRTDKYGEFYMVARRPIR